MDLTRILGRNVRRERRRLGKSQAELALDAEMKRSYLSDLERGTRNPSVKAIGRLPGRAWGQAEPVIGAIGF